MEQNKIYKRMESQQMQVTPAPSYVMNLFSRLRGKLKPQTPTLNTENPIDKSMQSATIKSMDHSDGGPGSGNFGHKGIDGQAGGSAPSGGASSASKGKLSEHDKKTLSARFIGKKTHDGIEIKKISSHAFDRLGGRQISAGRCEKMLSTGKASPGHTANTRCYDVPGSRIVIDTNSGTVVTVMWRKGNK